MEVLTFFKNAQVINSYGTTKCSTIMFVIMCGRSHVCYHVRKKTGDKLFGVIQSPNLCKI